MHAFFSDCFHFEGKNQLLETLSPPNMGTQVGDIGGLGPEGTLPAELEGISPESPPSQRSLMWRRKSFPEPGWAEDQTDEENLRGKQHTHLFM